MTFERKVERLADLPAFQEVVACVRAGVSWGDATEMTRLERRAFLRVYDDMEQAVADEIERRRASQDD